MFRTKQIDPTGVTTLGFYGRVDWDFAKKTCSWSNDKSGTHVATFGDGTDATDVDASRVFDDWIALNRGTMTHNIFPFSMGKTCADLS